MVLCYIIIEISFICKGFSLTFLIEAIIPRRAPPVTYRIAEAPGALFVDEPRLLAGLLYAIQRGLSHLEAEP